MEYLDVYSDESDDEIRRLKKQKQLEESRPEDTDAKYTSEDELLLRSLRTALQDVIPTESFSHQRLILWKKFEETVLLSKFPEIYGSSCIELFGSWTYGMWTVTSDIDVNVRTHTCIENFFKRLRIAVSAEYVGSDIRIIPNAKIPVCKITLPSGLNIDVTHEYGPENEQDRHNILVRDWARRWQADDVICSSIRFIKRWATANKIHNPCNGTLNSMGYLVMLLAIVSSDHCFDERGEGSASGHLQRVLDLLRCFFRTYRTLGQRKEVIAAPYGTVKMEGPEMDTMRLSMSVDDRDQRGVGSTVFIQDPFLAQINLGRFVDRYSVRKLRKEFARACEILAEGGGKAFQILLGCDKDSTHH